MVGGQLQRKRLGSWQKSKRPYDCFSDLKTGELLEAIQRKNTGKSWRDWSVIILLVEGRKIILKSENNILSKAVSTRLAKTQPMKLTVLTERSEVKNNK